jgi:hypothetical protein
MCELQYLRNFALAGNHNTIRQRKIQENKERKNKALPGGAMSGNIVKHGYFFVYFL